MGFFRSRNSATIKTLPMCYYGHPALKKQSGDIGVVDPEIRDLAERMLNTMYEHEGIGLAAPQVGRNVRLITLAVPPPNTSDESPPFSNTPGELMLLERMPLVLVNPRLSDFSEKTNDYIEGCLSMPVIKGCVVRPEFLQLEATDLDCAPISFRCGGLLSRCLQHEVDHLDGVLFTERMDPGELPPLADDLAALERETRQTLRRGR